MVRDKYFDWVKNMPVHVDEDGCNYNEWSHGYLSKKFAIHVKGFFVFLPPLEIKSLDEYVNGDPFGIESTIDGSFQKSRISTTLSILSSIKGTKGDNLRILDVGCGQGHITNSIKKHNPTAEISGLDVSISAIEYASDQFKGIDFAVGSAYIPPYSPEYFDVIICNNTYEHITDPVLMLMQIRKILKPGGYIIISTPSRYRINNLLRVFIGKRASISKHHITEYSVGQVYEHFRYAGFSMKLITSTPVLGQGGSVFMRIAIHKLLKPLLKSMLRIIGSNHILESTAFYCGIKNPD